MTYSIKIKETRHFLTKNPRFKTNIGASKMLDKQQEKNMNTYLNLFPVIGLIKK